jgi:hypothetical protein
MQGALEKDVLQEITSLRGELDFEYTNLWCLPNENIRKENQQTQDTWRKMMFKLGSSSLLDKYAKVCSRQENQYFKSFRSKRDIMLMKLKVAWYAEGVQTRRKGPG